MPKSLQESKQLNQPNQMFNKKLILWLILLWISAPELWAQCSSNCSEGNTFFGSGAGGFTGDDNSFFGAGAGALNNGDNNAFFGRRAGFINLSGSNNAFFGGRSGSLNSVGSANAFFGAYSGAGNTSGSNNSFFGASSGELNTSGNNNAFFGIFSGNKNTTGNFNAFFGASAGLNNSTGFNNAFFGGFAGNENTTGENNSFFGTSAGLKNTTGKENAFFGSFAGNQNTTGNFNAFFGTSTGQNNSTGSKNAFFGNFAGNANTTGEENSFFGTSAGNKNKQGGANAFFGYQAGFENTAGGANAFFGHNAGRVNTVGLFNAFFGQGSGAKNTTGGANAFFGQGSGEDNTSGSLNAFFGQFSGQNNTTGRENAFLGQNSGNLNTTGRFNTYVGSDAGQTNVTGNNNVFLGYKSGAQEKGSDKLYIANSDTTRPLIYGDFEKNEMTVHGSLDVKGDIFLDAYDIISAGDSKITFGLIPENQNTSIPNNEDDDIYVHIANNGEFGVTNDNKLALNIGPRIREPKLDNGGQIQLGPQGDFNVNIAIENDALGRSDSKTEVRIGDLNFDDNNNSVIFFEPPGWGRPDIYGELRFGDEQHFLRGDGARGTTLQDPNGIFFNTGTNTPVTRMVLDKNGQLGIGVDQPERPIHLRATNAIFRIDRDRNDPGFAVVRYDNGFNNVWKSFYFYTRGNGPNDGKFIIADWGQNVSGPSTARLVVANDGNVGIGNFLFSDPSEKLTVNGNVLATGSFITSDKRFKKQIKKLPNALENLNLLNGVKYEYDTQKFAERNLPAGKTIGLIAQEVQKVYPELVKEDASGYLSVNYDGLVPVLIEALKEQQAEITALQEEVQQIKNSTNAHLISQVESEEAQLFQNHPNPFDKSTTIPYYLPENVSKAQILITDLQGRELNRISIQNLGKGQIELKVDTFQKGIYLYTLIVDGQLMESKRMLIE